MPHRLLRGGHLLRAATTATESAADSIEPACAAERHTLAVGVGQVYAVFELRTTRTPARAVTALEFEQIRAAVGPMLAVGVRARTLAGCFRRSSSC